MTKKRYNLTLTQESVEDFQTVARSLGMPVSIMSTVCDEAIVSVCRVFKKAKEKGGFSMSDMLTMMAEQTAEIENEGKKRDEELKETTKKGKINN